MKRGNNGQFLSQRYEYDPQPGPSGYNNRLITPMASNQQRYEYDPQPGPSGYNNRLITPMASNQQPVLFNTPMDVDDDYQRSSKKYPSRTQSLVAVCSNSSIWNQRQTRMDICTSSSGENFSDKMDVDEDPIPESTETQNKPKRPAFRYVVRTPHKKHKNRN